MDKPKQISKMSDLSFKYKHHVSYLSSSNLKCPLFWNVPQRNLNFTGRKEELAKIEQTLNLPNVSTVACVGLGGIGKTDLVLEYVYKNKEKYSGGIAWFFGQNMYSMLQQFEALGKELVMVVRGKSESSLLTSWRKIKFWLEQQPDWLLIFDDVKNSEMLLNKEYKCKIIVTSRYVVWDNIVVLNTFERFKSIEYFKKVCPERADDNDWNELANILADFPLALDQASTYLNGNVTVSVAQYLKMYETQKRNFLSAKVLNNYNKVPVYFTWDKTITTITKQSRLAIQLLRVLAFLAPNNIPYDILEDFGDILESTNCEWGHAIELFQILLRYSLLTYNQKEKILSMNSLLQEVLRLKAVEEENVDFLIKALISFRLWFKKNQEAFINDKDLGQLAAVATHLEHLYQHVQHFSNCNLIKEQDFFEFDKLLFNLGEIYYYLDMYEKSLDITKINLSKVEARSQQENKKMLDVSDRDYPINELFDHDNKKNSNTTSRRNSLDAFTIFSYNYVEVTKEPEQEQITVGNLFTTIAAVLSPLIRLKINLWTNNNHYDHNPNRLAEVQKCVDKSEKYFGVKLIPSPLKNYPRHIPVLLSLAWDYSGITYDFEAEYFVFKLKGLLGTSRKNDWFESLQAAGDAYFLQNQITKAREAYEKSLICGTPLYGTNNFNVLKARLCVCMMSYIVNGKEETFLQIKHIFNTNSYSAKSTFLNSMLLDLVLEYSYDAFKFGHDRMAVQCLKDFFYLQYLCEHSKYIITVISKEALLSIFTNKPLISEYKESILNFEHRFERNNDDYQAFLNISDLLLLFQLLCVSNKMLPKFCGEITNEGFFKLLCLWPDTISISLCDDSFDFVCSFLRIVQPIPLTNLDMCRLLLRKGEILCHLKDYDSAYKIFKRLTDLRIEWYDEPSEKIIKRLDSIFKALKSKNHARVEMNLWRFRDIKKADSRSCLITAQYMPIFQQEDSVGSGVKFTPVSVAAQG